MKFPTLPKILAVAVTALLFAVPAESFAKDKHDDDDKKHDRDKKHEHDKHRHDDRHDSHRPNVAVSLYSRPYYRDYGYRPYVRPSVTYVRPSYSSYDDDTAVAVQRGLRRRGYYYGPVDGDIGPGTRSAIRAYQADHGLRPTGYISDGLLNSLGV